MLENCQRVSFTHGCLARELRETFACDVNESLMMAITASTGKFLKAPHD